MLKCILKWKTEENIGEQEENKFHYRVLEAIALFIGTFGENFRQPSWSRCEQCEGNNSQ